MRIATFVALWALSIPLSAQGYYLGADSAASPICPQMAIENDPRLTRGAPGARMDSTRTYREETSVLPPETRPDLSAVTFYDEKKKATTVASLKGKIVVIGLWGYRCTPSTRMLMEMAKAAKVADRYGLAFMPMNYDANRITEDSRTLGGWPAIHHFMVEQRAFLAETPLTLGVCGPGNENPGHFLGTVNSIPVMMVVDRTGHLATIDIGFKEGMVGQRLSLLIKEEQAAKAAAKAQP